MCKYNKVMFEYELGKFFLSTSMHHKKEENVSFRMKELLKSFRD